MFSISLSAQVDRSRFMAARALAVNGSPEDKERFGRIERDPQPAFRRLVSFSEYQSETIIIRIVDNFMSYLSEILQLCMLKRPEILRSNEQIRTEDVLRFTHRSELLDFLINRKLNELTYGGIRGIEEFLNQRLAIPLTSDDQMRHYLSITIELRNIYTHNRGVVNELFVSRISGIEHDYKFVIGDRFHADYDQIVIFSSNLFKIVQFLDKRVAEKFKIRKRKFGTWDAARIKRLGEVKLPPLDLEFP